MKCAFVLVLFILLALPMVHASNTDIVILAGEVPLPVGQPVSFSAMAAANFPTLNVRESTTTVTALASKLAPPLTTQMFSINAFTNFPQMALRETSIAFSALFAGFNQQFINNPISINAQANTQPIMPQIVERQISVELESSIQPIMPQVGENPITINAQANINPIAPQVLQPTRIPSIGFATNFPLNAGSGIRFSGNIPLRALPEGPIRPTGEFHIRTADLDRDFDP